MERKLFLCPGPVSSQAPWTHVTERSSARLQVGFVRKFQSFLVQLSLCWEQTQGCRRSGSGGKWKDKAAEGEQPAYRRERQPKAVVRGASHLRSPSAQQARLAAAAEGAAIPLSLRRLGAHQQGG